MGAFNASFLETDGLAAAGPDATLIACAAFSIILIAINSALNGLPRVLIALTMCVASIAFINVPMMTALLTEGILPASLLLAFAPRGEFWVKSKAG
jgi:hypothetical protein